MTRGIAAVAYIAAFAASCLAMPAVATGAGRAPYVATALIANGGGDRLDVVARVTTARPNVRCTATAKQGRRSAELPRLRTGAKGGGQWHWYVGDGAPRGALTIHVRCAFPNGRTRKATITRTVGPGPYPRREFRALVRPGSLRTEPWVPEKKHDGSGQGGADLYPRGQCTWYVAKRRPDLPYFPGVSGDARNWITSAQAEQIPTGPQPVVGAVAVFRPGQYGAGYYGHVAYVTAIGASTITVAEANYKNRKAGSPRTIPSEGVRFIYRDALPPPPPAPPPPPPAPPPPPPPLPPELLTRLVSGPAGLAGATANGSSSRPAISNSGRYLAFSSAASNLDPSDDNENADILLHDLQSGTTTLVSRSTGGATGNGDSLDPGVSDDGRYVLFESDASNLDPGEDDDTTRDVFIRDLVAGTTKLVSRASGTSGAKGNSHSFNSAFSDDGRYVTFESYASNLDPADGDTSSDVFVRDLQNDTTTLVSRASGAEGAKATGSSVTPDISDDGRHVVFASSGTNLDPADTDGARDIFVRNLDSNTTTLVSRAGGVSGAKGDDASTADPKISVDGRVVAFASMASNLDPADGDSRMDVFARDVPAATTTLISRATSLTGAKADADATDPDLSFDGRYVTFATDAQNLDAAAPDLVTEIYLRDLESGVTTLVSRATGNDGEAGDRPSVTPVVSAYGRLVAFMSEASNLDLADGDTTDAFVRDIANATTTLATRATGSTGTKGESATASVSDDGRFVAFRSSTSKLDPDDSDSDADVLVRDTQTGTTRLASRATGPTGAAGNGGSDQPSISADGRLVAFTSDSTNLDSVEHEGSFDFDSDVFVRNLDAGTTTRLTGVADRGRNHRAGEPRISGNGRYVAFASDDPDLDPDDSADGSDIFVHDLQNGSTALVSRASGFPGVPGDGESFAPSISGDGRFVAFISYAMNLSHDHGAGSGVYVRDLQSGLTTLASRSSGVAGPPANSPSSSAAISADGRFVAFASGASNLDPSDNDGRRDIFVRDLQGATTALVSRAGGSAAIKGNGASDLPDISGDGRYVTFQSSALNLDPADNDATSDVFLRDTQQVTTTLVSRASGAGGFAGDGSSTNPAISDDGRYVGFDSSSTNLDQADSDAIRDVFVRGPLGAFP